VQSGNRRRSCPADTFIICGFRFFTSVDLYGVTGKAVREIEGAFDSFHILLVELLSTLLIVALGEHALIASVKYDRTLF